MTQILPGWEEQLSSQRRKVDSDNFDITVRELVRMVDDGELERAPEYQRQFRWRPIQESKLVESVFLGLPVPTIYVATNSDGTWEIVDGLQRISSLIHFVSNEEKLLETVGKKSPLVLYGLEKLSSFNGFSFKDLPLPIQLAFLKRSLRITSLSDKADKDVRFDMFERLNTGGIILTAQEIRACIYRGESISFLRKLSKNSDFKKLIKLKSGNENDGTAEELVLKTFAYKENRENFRGDIKHFLTEYIKTMQKDYNFSHRENLFNQSISSLSKVVTGYILKPNVGWTPINLAEGILVAALELTEAGVSDFTPKDGWTADKILTSASTGGTNTNSALRTRIDRAKELLQGAEITKNDTQLNM